jgi:hypothetical protein
MLSCFPGNKRKAEHTRRVHRSVRCPACSLLGFSPSSLLIVTMRASTSHECDYRGSSPSAGLWPVNPTCMRNSRILYPMADRKNREGNQKNTGKRASPFAFPCCLCEKPCKPGSCQIQRFFSHRKTSADDGNRSLQPDAVLSIPSHCVQSFCIVSQKSREALFLP